jgi:hypothetical protein
MRWLVRRTVRGLIASAIMSLALAGIALGAASGAYRGKTSQKQRASLRIGGGAVHSFKLIVLDKCPDGHTLSVTATYPTMKISNGTFGGSFAPAGGRPGEKALLKGRVGRGNVTGTLNDTSYSNREGALCHGSLRFSATHV